MTYRWVGVYCCNIFNLRPYKDVWLSCTLTLPTNDASRSLERVSCVGVTASLNNVEKRNISTSTGNRSPIPRSSNPYRKYCRDWENQLQFAMKEYEKSENLFLSPLKPKIDLKHYFTENRIGRRQEDQSLQDNWYWLSKFYERHKWTLLVKFRILVGYKRWHVWQTSCF